MVRQIIKVISLAFVILSLSNGCYYDKADKLYPNVGCDTTEVLFSRDVLPVLKVNCTDLACHTSGNPSGAIKLQTYTEVKDALLNNKLMNALNQIYPSGSSKNMPPSAPKLNDCDLSKIQVWINRGAKDN